MALETRKGGFNQLPFCPIGPVIIPNGVRVPRIVNEGCDINVSWRGFTRCHSVQEHYQSIEKPHITVQNKCSQTETALRSCV